MHVDVRREGTQIQLSNHYEWTTVNGLFYCCCCCLTDCGLALHQFFFYFYFPFSSTFSPLLLLGLYGIANGVYITCVCVWMAFRDACRHPHGRNRYLIEFSSIYFRAHNIPSIDILYCGVYNIRSDEAHIICVFQQTEDGEKELYSTSTSQCCCVEAHYITESINLLISFNLFLFRSDRRFVCSCSIWK